MRSKVQQFLLILCKPVFVHTCCSVSNKPGLEHIFWSGLTLYSSTNVLALPQNPTKTRIHHNQCSNVEPEYFVYVEKSKIVIRHSRNLLSLLLHSGLRSFTRLPKKQTHVKYYTVTELVTENKTGIDGIFFNLRGKVQNDRKKHTSEPKKLLLAKEHSLKNMPKQ